MNPNRSRPIPKGSSSEPSAGSVAISSLFSGAEPIINGELGGASYGSRRTFQLLSKSPPNPFTGARLVQQLYDLISGRWHQLLPRLKRLPPSTQNWRWFDPKTDIHESNDGPEQTLERAIVNACLTLGRRDWSNQVPIASGIVGPSAHKTSAIDLIHKRHEWAFDFVELKVNSNTPISAAFQITLYGLIWILSSRDRGRLLYPKTPILEAKAVTLSVLAPAKYYGDSDLTWLSAALSDGLAGIAKREIGADMNLVFEQFHESFRWPSDHTPEALCGFLDGRRRR